MPRRSHTMPDCACIKYNRTDYYVSFCMGRPQFALDDYKMSPWLPHVQPEFFIKSITDLYVEPLVHCSFWCLPSMHFFHFRPVNERRAIAYTHLITHLKMEDCFLLTCITSGEIPFQTSNSSHNCIQILNEIEEYVL